MGFYNDWQAIIRQNGTINHSHEARDSCQRCKLTVKLLQVMLIKLGAHYNYAK